jgi:cobalt/nickel transport system ATP-binding protein
MIEMHNVTFAYQNGPPVLENLSFRIEEGDRVGIFGPNGSGKTTLLQMIVGLLKAQRGDVVIFGRERKEEADFLEVRRKIGFLFQDPDDQLFCPTVKEDVAFGPLNLGLGVKEVEEIVEGTLTALNLYHLKEKIIFRLSGGEKRLVSLATVMAMKPLVVVLDEPTAGLDQDTTLMLTQVLREHFNTYLIVSHDREFLQATVDRIYRMENGKIYHLEHI